MEPVGGSRKAVGEGFGRVRMSFGITRDEGGLAMAKAPLEFKSRISADRDADQCGPIGCSGVHYVSNIKGVLLHSRWPRSERRFTVPAQVGHDHAITGRQHPRDWLPEFMICGKRMQKDDWRPAAGHTVADFSVG